MQKKAFPTCGYPKEIPQNPTKPTNHLPKFSGTPNIRKLSLATRRSRNRVKMGGRRLPSTYIKSQHGNTESGTPTIPRLKKITPQRTNDRLPPPSIKPNLTEAQYQAMRGNGKKICAKKWRIDGP
jgi:hypothetical protein